MPRRLEYTQEALADIESQAANLAEFDIGAANEFPMFVRRSLLNACEEPAMYPLVDRRPNCELRKFIVKSRTILYLAYDDVIILLRVFGPGRDWQGEI